VYGGYVNDEELLIAVANTAHGEGDEWVFLDSSRNTSRRWCDMAACGNRAKSASFRSRHRGTTEA
jgi:predicted RNA-binding Zn ribbon-like protein